MHDIQYTHIICTYTYIYILHIHTGTYYILHITYTYTYILHITYTYTYYTYYILHIYIYTYTYMLITYTYMLITYTYTTYTYTTYTYIHIYIYVYNPQFNMFYSPLRIHLRNEAIQDFCSSEPASCAACAWERLPAPPWMGRFNHQVGSQAETPLETHW